MNLTKTRNTTKYIAIRELSEENKSYSISALCEFAGITTGRSRNITCICCTQSYSSLFDGYDDNELNSLIANFSYVAALDVKDSDGRDFFKKICGKKNFKIYNWSSKSSGGYSKSVRYEQRDVVDEFFLQTLHNRLECILINSYSGFAIFNRCAYFEDPDKKMAQIVAENERMNK